MNSSRGIVNLTLNIYMGKNPQKNTRSPGYHRERRMCTPLIVVVSYTREKFVLSTPEVRVPCSSGASTFLHLRLCCSEGLMIKYSFSRTGEKLDLIYGTEFLFAVGILVVLMNLSPKFQCRPDGFVPFRVVLKLPLEVYKGINFNGGTCWISDYLMAIWLGYVIISDVLMVIKSVCCHAWMKID